MFSFHFLLKTSKETKTTTLCKIALLESLSLFSFSYCHIRKTAFPKDPNELSSQFPLCHMKTVNQSLLYCYAFSFLDLKKKIKCKKLWPKPRKTFNYFFLKFTYKFFKNVFIDYAITVVPFPPLHSTPSCPSLPSHIPPYSSRPWVIHISSLASTFPTLFLPSPYLFSTYHLCYLFSVPFPLLSPSHCPVDNPSCDLHFCGSVPVLVVCLVCFRFCFRCGC